MKSEKHHDQRVKWEVVYSDGDCDQIWKYDLTKFENGPISVETTWKPHVLKEWKEDKSLKSVRVKTKAKDAKATTGKRNKRVDAKVRKQG
jgi:hypothetical protein